MDESLLVTLFELTSVLEGVRIERLEHASDEVVRVMVSKNGATLKKSNKYCCDPLRLQIGQQTTSSRRAAAWSCWILTPARRFRMRPLRDSRLAEDLS